MTIHGPEHVGVYNARVDRDDEDVRIFCRDILEELQLGELGAYVCGGARGGGVGGGDSDHVGVQADDGGVVISGGEEGTRCYHCAFHVCLNGTELM